MPSTVQSVERAFAILETFDDAHPSRSAGDIAAATGLARPTTYRMLQTLQQLGYVRNDGGRFEVTPRVLRLGAGCVGRDSLASRAQPVLDRLSREIGEHVAVGVLTGDEVVAVAAADSPGSRLLAVAIRVGQRLPARTTALGRVLLAHADAATHGAEPAIRLDAHEVATITGDGFALADGLLESGLRALAVPVTDQEGAVVAALSVAVHTGRATLDEMSERFLPPLLRAAADITDRL